MLLKTILFILLTNQNCGFGISNSYRRPLKNNVSVRKNNYETSNGWKPLIQRSINTDYSYYQTKGLQSELNMYVTPQPLGTVERNSTERLIINNNRKETNDSTMTLQIEPLFGQNKDNRQDLDTIIEKKIEKSLEKFFYKFDKMLETAMQDAVKKINIHHSPTEAGNGGVSPLPNNTGTVDYTAEEEDTEPSRKSEVTNNLSLNENTSSTKKAGLDSNVQERSLILASADGESVPKRVAKSVHASGSLDRFFKTGYNSAEHSPPDPFVALFLSHYGKYLPQGRPIAPYYGNLYSYLASNNLHNNKPFGSYKIYEDVNE